MPNRPKGSLNDKQLKVAELYMQGRSQQDIADETGMSQSAVSRLLARSDVLSMLREQGNRKLEKMKQDLNASELKALEKVKAMLDDENKWVALQACRIIFERADAAKAREDTTIVVNFVNMKAPMLPDVEEESPSGEAVPASGSVK